MMPADRPAARFAAAAVCGVARDSTRYARRWCGHAL